MTRYAIFTKGYVNEDGSVIEPKRLIHLDTLLEAETYLEVHCEIYNLDKSDFYSVQEQKYFSAWESIDGTRIEY